LTGADLVMVTAIVVLLAIATFLSVAETALTRMSKVKAQALVEANRRGSGPLLRLVEKPETFLNPVLLVVLVSQLVQATLTGVVATRLFGPWGVVVATFINVVFVFVFAEAAPKTWAVQHPDAAALFVARPVAALVRFPPIQWLSRALIGLTNVILPGKGLKEGPWVSEEELLALADQAAEEEVIEHEERDLIESIIEFGDTTAREVMVPRPDMVTVDADFRVADAMEVVILNGYSRIPVSGEGIDDVVGLLYAKDLMRAERDGHSDGSVADFLRPAHFVPETKRVPELLREMQTEHFHMAVVVDEYGGTAGLVTLEDLIEELVGEIVDEFDQEEPMIEPLSDGSVRVNARMSVDELNDLLHAELPEGDWNTVGGLMFHLLGHVPVEGEQVTADGHVLRAERVQGRRIGRVRIASATPSAPVLDLAVSAENGPPE
jgi:CBS domain containing-hemolysin-like protein